MASCTFYQWGSGGRQVYWIMWNWYIFRILRGSQFQVVQLYRIILRKSKTILVLFITEHYCYCITQFKFLCTAKSKTKVVFKTICWAACSWKFHQIGPLYYFIKIFFKYTFGLFALSKLPFSCNFFLRMKLSFFSTQLIHTVTKSMQSCFGKKMIVCESYIDLLLFMRFPWTDGYK